tara:strand:+ start:365 stop:550 length:186 start_codon:yes stop_codon:yes gene_type:complete
MIVFTIIGIVAVIFLMIVVVVTIIEDRIKSKSNERIIWKMDKVETRTGGLAHDRINESKKK